METEPENIFERVLDFIEEKYDLIHNRLNPKIWIPIVIAVAILCAGSVYLIISNKSKSQNVATNKTTQVNKTTQKLSQPLSKTGTCGDGTCDDVERNTGKCPSDCNTNNSPIDNATTTIKKADTIDTTATTPKTTKTTNTSASNNSSKKSSSDNNDKSIVDKAVDAVKNIIDDIISTCSDGVQNQDETGVDCGGTCAACATTNICGDGTCSITETNATCSSDCPAATTFKPLDFAAVLHVEGGMKFDSDETMYLHENETLKQIIDLFKKYDAKITIESEEPYLKAATKWPNDENMLNYALDNGQGVGTHCDFDSMSQDAAAAAYKERKDMVDAVVGADNNLGCSGGWGEEQDWAQAANSAGFSYLDCPVMLAYLTVPLENRPINPDTGTYYTDAEIQKTYYHDSVPPELEDAIYPRRLKDTNDLVGDDSGILLIPGSLGELNSLSEGRKTCYPSCSLTADDTNYILSKIDYINSVKDSSKVSSLNLHFPDYTVKKGGDAALTIVEDWLKQMQTYQNEGKIKWVTMKEIYNEYAAGGSTTDVCGDGTCSTTETYATCPTDCQTPAVSYTNVYSDTDGNNRLYVSEKGSNRIDIYDLNTLKLVDQITLNTGEYPSDSLRIYVDANEKVALLNSKEMTTFELLDLNTKKIRCSVSVGKDDIGWMDTKDKLFIQSAMTGQFILYDYNCVEQKSIPKDSIIISKTSQNGELGVFNAKDFSVSILNLASGTNTDSFSIADNGTTLLPQHNMVLSNNWFAANFNQTTKKEVDVAVYDRNAKKTFWITTPGSTVAKSLKAVYLVNDYYFLGVNDNGKQEITVFDLKNKNILNKISVSDDMVSYAVDSAGQNVFIMDSTGKITKTAIQTTQVAATCSDGIKNQDETGVDCGGSCTVCPIVEKCGDGTCSASETATSCPADCKTLDNSDYYKGMNIVFDVHSHADFITTEAGGEDFCNLDKSYQTASVEKRYSNFQTQLNDLQWVKDLTDKYNIPISFLSVAPFAELCTCGSSDQPTCDDATKAKCLALIKSIYDKGSLIGFHSHTYKYNGFNDWIDWEANKTPVSLTDQESMLSTGIDMVRNLVTEVTGETDANKINDIMNMIGSPNPTDPNGYYDFYSGQGFKMKEPGDEEKFQQYFNQITWNPFRVKKGTIFQEDFNSKLVAIGGSGPIYDTDTHVGLGINSKTERQKAMFLQEYVNWRELNNGKVWTYGWGSHIHDFMTDNHGETSRQNLIDMLAWLKPFVDKGNARFTSLENVYDDFLKWEKKNPNTSSFNYTATTTDYTQYPYLEKASKYLRNGILDKELVMNNGEKAYVLKVGDYLEKGEKPSYKVVLAFSDLGTTAVNLSSEFSTSTLRMTNLKSGATSSVNASGVSIGKDAVVLCVDADCDAVLADTSEPTAYKPDCSSSINPVAGSKCGDGACNSPETSTNCPADCGTSALSATTKTTSTSTTGMLGKLVNRAIEFVGRKCGDGVCDDREKSDVTLCPTDCGSSATSATTSTASTSDSNTSTTSNTGVLGQLVDKTMEFIGRKCGDGICDAKEKANPSLCSKDCGTTTTQSASGSSTATQGGCGDGTCSGPETNANCPQDCKTATSTSTTNQGGCGDGTCSGPETNINCPQDCKTATPASSSTSTTATKSGCGDGTCKTPETNANCPQDCKTATTKSSTTTTTQGTCGDGICGSVEKTKGTCPQDCK